MFQRAVDMSPDEPDCLCNLAQFLHVRLKQHKAARKMYRRALRWEKTTTKRPQIDHKSTTKRPQIDHKSTTNRPQIDCPFLREFASVCGHDAAHAYK